MDNENSNELNQIRNRIHALAVELQKIAEELKRDVEAFESGESVASIEARRGLGDENIDSLE